MILKYFVAAALILHGLAHLSGFVAAFTSRDTGFSPKPWLFSPNVTIHSAIGRVFGLLWLVAAVALAGAGLALLLGWAVWPWLPIAGAIVSLLVIATWWNTVPPGARLGAVFDLIILVALLPGWREQVMTLISI
jgi:DNA-binding transcriptional LysR family regulator